MRRTAVIFLAAAALGALVAVVQHGQSRRTRAELEQERLRLLADTRRVRAQAAETKRQVEAMRTRATAVAVRPKTTAPASGAEASSATSANARTPAPASSAAGGPNPEMRGLRVQSFVGEQRMQFGALLHRLGFTAAQRQEFDRIQAEFYRAVLDEKLDPAGRQQVRDTRIAALRELFGANYEAWLEANRQQSARAIVDLMIAQTFPSSGALNAAQADELTRIVAEHRVKGPAVDRPDAANYDWERIVADARTILADRQMEDFAAAVSYRRASDQMSAMVRDAKR